LKLFLGFLLSGFFILPHRWIQWIGVLFILPWAVPSIPTILSVRWMLNTEWGMLNNLLEQVGIGGPWWLLRPDLALSAAIAVHIWKFLPFWTLIFLAARMAIPKEVYESAALDGATGIRGLVHVTFPLVSGIYLAGTLLSTLWTLGDFNSVFLLTGGGPVDATHVLATLGIRYAFLIGDVRTGVAVVLTGLPFLVPLAIYLMRLLGRISSA
jgi:multiple sugar transport system permease protein